MTSAALVEPIAVAVHLEDVDVMGEAVEERALAGITSIEAANCFIAEVYLPAHNARFAVPPEHPGSAFVHDRAGAHRDILCLHEERTVGNDNCVRYRGLALQIPPSSLRPHYVKARVRVHEYADGPLAVFHGPKRLADYAPDGTPIEEKHRAAA